MHRRQTKTKQHERGTKDSEHQCGDLPKGRDLTKLSLYPRHATVKSDNVFPRAGDDAPLLFLLGLDAGDDASLLYLLGLNAGNIRLNAGDIRLNAGNIRLDAGNVVSQLFLLDLNVVQIDLNVVQQRLQPPEDVQGLVIMGLSGNGRSHGEFSSPIMAPRWRFWLEKSTSRMTITH
ncbi:MAG: hypothetical protein H7840_17285 [Alphaproteobacteria bacterium]